MLDRQSLARSGRREEDSHGRVACFEPLEARLLLTGAIGAVYDGLAGPAGPADPAGGIIVSAATESGPVLITGGVVDSVTGLPLAGIEVQVLQGADPQDGGQFAWDYVTSVFTDTSGNYEISGLADRVYRLRVPDGQSDGINHFVGGNIFDVPVSDGAVAAGMDFSLHYAGSIVGYVYNSSETPLGGIEVLVKADYVPGDQADGWHQARTDSTGRYEIYLPKTAQEIYPVKIAHSQDSYGDPYGVQIAPGLYSAPLVGSAGPDFYLEPGGWLTGSVQTPGGLPVANATDVLEPDVLIDNGVYEDPNVSTDQYGDFRVPIPAGTDVYMTTCDWSWARYDIAGDHFAWGRRVLGPFNVAAGGTVTMPTLVVPEAVGVSGTVTDPLGNPIEGVEISAVGFDTAGGQFWVGDEDAVVTDQAGQYNFDWIPAGQFMLVASADGYLDYDSGMIFDLAGGADGTYDLVLTPAEQGAVVSGEVSNFTQLAPTYNAQPLPYQSIDYGEYLLGGEIGVMAYDATRPWSRQDMQLPDQRWTGQTDVEDGYGDYFVPTEGAGGYQLTLPAGSQTLLAYHVRTTSAGGWSVNLGDPLTISAIGAGDALSGQDLAIPLGDNSVSGAVIFPTDYPGGAPAVMVALHQAGSSDDGLGRAAAEPGPAGLYAMEDIPDGTYYIQAVANGLATFTSQQFTIGNGGSADVDIVFEYPADLAFDPPGETNIQTEIGSVVPLPFDLVNLGQAAAGDVAIQLYASDDATVDSSDTPLTMLPPGSAWPDQWAFVAPDSPGTFYIAAVADPDNAVYESDETNNWSDTISLTLIDESQVTQLSFADYFPLLPGAVRRYRFRLTDPDGRSTTSAVRSVVTADPVQFNGDQTTELRKFLNGRHISSTYYSFDVDGLHIHGQEQFADGQWTSIGFDQALMMAPADVSIGMVHNATASWTGAAPDGSEWTGTYSQQVTVVGFEEITTPAGTYNALRLQFQINADKSGDGVDAAIGDAYDAWLAEGVGVVAERGIWTETTGEQTSVWTFRYDLSAAPQQGQVGGAQVVDLVASFPESYVPPAQLIPGRRITVPVMVQNQGTDAVNARLAMEIYRSTDQFLDGADIRLHTQAGMRVRLAPGASRVYNIRFTVPDTGQAGPCFLLAYVDADNVVTEVWEDNNVAAPGLASQYSYQFGTVNGARNVSLTMLDQFGTPVTFSLRGGGYGEVARNESGQLDVTYYQSTTRSAATIRSPYGLNGVVNDVNVVSSQTSEFLSYPSSSGPGGPVDGSLRSLTARRIDLTGNIDVDGWVGSVLMDDIATASGMDEYGHTIWIGQGVSPRSTVRLTFGSVGETSIISAVPIRRLTASEWTDNDETPDRITAPRLDGLTIRGDRRRDIAGHFGADLALGLAGGDGDLLNMGQGDSPSPIAWPTVLGTVRISGDLYDAQWDIVGAMGNVTVKGRIEGATVRTAGSMGRIAFGGIVDSDFLAGVDQGVERRAENPQDIVNPAALIRAVTISPSRRQGSESGTVFQNSNFSAAGIGRVSLAGLETYNAGEQFGFYAGTITSIRHRGAEPGESWTWRKGTDGTLYLDDFLADAFNVAGPGDGLE